MEKQKTGLHTGLGIGSLVVGIIALLIAFIPCLGQFAIFIAPIAIIMGLGGYYIAKNSNQSSGLNLGGIIISTIAFYIAWWQISSLNDANNYMSKQMGGSGNNSVGYLHVIVAIVIIGAILLINYLTRQKSNQQQIPVTNSATSISESTTETATTSNSTNINFQDVFQRNLKVIIAATVAIITGIAVWFFLRANPESDAKQVAKEKCNCEQTDVNERIKVYEGFLSSFEGYKFNGTDEAWEKLQALENPSHEIYMECLAKADANLAQKKANYLADPAKMQLFESVYNTLSVNCATEGVAKMTTAKNNITDKISSIPDSKVSIDNLEVNPRSESSQNDEEAISMDDADYNTGGEAEEPIATGPIAEYVGTYKGFGEFAGKLLRIYPGLEYEFDNVTYTSKVALKDLSAVAIENYSNKYTERLKHNVRVKNQGLSIPMLELSNGKKISTLLLVIDEKPIRMHHDKDSYFIKD